MKYSDIKIGDFVDAVIDTSKNYRVIGKVNGWVKVRMMWPGFQDLVYSVRAKSLIDHDLVAANNRQIAHKHFLSQMAKAERKLTKQPNPYRG